MYEMKKIIYAILLCLFPLGLSADEFIVYQIHSKNALLKTIAEGIIRTKVEDKVLISIVDDIAYITNYLFCCAIDKVVIISLQFNSDFLISCHFFRLLKIL